MSGTHDAPNPDLACYATISDYEHHFNGMEFEVRKLASAWLLVSFGAIAFVVRGELGTSRMLEAAPTLIVIACLTNVGLLVLWMLDQVVYHGLLDAVFVTALRIEQKYPQLPPIRSMMMVISGGRGMARYLAYFYLVPMGILSLIAIIAAIQLPAKDVSFWWPLALLTAAFPIYVAAKRAAMLSLAPRRATCAWRLRE